MDRYKQIHYYTRLSNKNEVKIQFSAEKNLFETKSKVQINEIVVSVYPIPHGGGGGGGDSAHPQTVFFITFIRIVEEPQNLETFPKI